MRFRLAPTLMTLDDLERPKRPVSTELIECFASKVSERSCGQLL